MFWRKIKKLCPGWHEVVLSDRQIAFIVQVLNLYYEAGDKREGTLIANINKQLTKGI